MRDEPKITMGMTTAPVMIAAGMDGKMRTGPNETKMSRRQRWRPWRRIDELSS